MKNSRSVNKASSRDLGSFDGFYRIVYIHVSSKIVLEHRVMFRTASQISGQEEDRSGGSNMVGNSRNQEDCSSPLGLNEGVDAARLQFIRPAQSSACTRPIRFCTGRWHLPTACTFGKSLE